MTTLGVLVAAGLPAMRLSLAGIGREMAASDDGAAKHAVRRMYWFLCNERVELVEMMPTVVSWPLRRRLK